jgi:hypothetical protein
MSFGWGTQQCGSRWAGPLLDDPVRQMRDAGSVDDPLEVQLQRTGVEIVQQANAATQHDGHQADDQLVKQSGADGLLNDARPHQMDVFPTGGSPSLVDRDFDTLGHERVGRVPACTGLGTR